MNPFLISPPLHVFPLSGGDETFLSDFRGNFWSGEERNTTAG
jgi:hypothetical protein